MTCSEVICTEVIYNRGKLEAATEIAGHGVCHTRMIHRGGDPTEVGTGPCTT